MFSFLKKNSRTNYIKNVDKLHNQRVKEEDKQLKLARKKVDYGASLKECDRLFSRVINDQLSKIRELQDSGVEVWDNEKTEIQQAAIGRLLVRRAQIELDHTSSENDLSKAMNMLGMAMLYTKKLQTVDVNGVGLLQSKMIDNAIPSNQSKDIMHTDISTSYTVPEEIVNKIDDTFVTNLINGNSFEECLNKNNYMGNRAKVEKVVGVELPNNNIKSVDDLLNKPL